MTVKLIPITKAYRDGYEAVNWERPCAEQWCHFDGMADKPDWWDVVADECVRDSVSAPVSPMGVSFGDKE